MFVTIHEAYVRGLIVPSYRAGASVVSMKVSNIFTLGHWVLDLCWLFRREYLVFPGSDGVTEDVADSEPSYFFHHIVGMFRSRFGQVFVAYWAPKEQRLIHDGLLTCDSFASEVDVDYLMGLKIRPAEIDPPVKHQHGFLPFCSHYLLVV